MPLYRRRDAATASGVRLARRAGEPRRRRAARSATARCRSGGTARTGRRVSSHARRRRARRRPPGPARARTPSGGSTQRRAAAGTAVLRHGLVVEALLVVRLRQPAVTRSFHAVPAPQQRSLGRSPGAAAGCRRSTSPSRSAPPGSGAVRRGRRGRRRPHCRRGEHRLPRTASTTTSDQRPLSCAPPDEGQPRPGERRRRRGRRAAVRRRRHRDVRPAAARTGRRRGARSSGSCRPALSARIMPMRRDQPGDHPQHVPSPAVTADWNAARRRRTPASRRPPPGCPGRLGRPRRRGRSRCSTRPARSPRCRDQREQTDAVVAW